MRALIRRRRVFLLALAGLGALVAYCEFVKPLLNPLSRSSDQIAACLREQTPRGTPRAEWKCSSKRGGWPRGGVRFEKVGDPLIEVRVGHYSGCILDVAVFTVWQSGKTCLATCLKSLTGMSSRFTAENS